VQTATKCKCKSFNHSTPFIAVDASGDYSEALRHYSLALEAFLSVLKSAFVCSILLFTNQSFMSSGKESSHQTNAIRTTKILFMISYLFHRNSSQGKVNTYMNRAEELKELLEGCVFIPSFCPRADEGEEVRQSVVAIVAFSFRHHRSRHLLTRLVPLLLRL